MIEDPSISEEFLDTCDLSNQPETNKKIWLDFGKRGEQAFDIEWESNLASNYGPIYQLNGFVNDRVAPKIGVYFEIKTKTKLASEMIRKNGLVFLNMKSVDDKRRLQERNKDHTYVIAIHIEGKPWYAIKVDDIPLDDKVQWSKKKVKGSGDPEYTVSINLFQQLEKLLKDETE